MALPIKVMLLLLVNAPPISAERMQSIEQVSLNKDTNEDLEQNTIDLGEDVVDNRQKDTAEHLKEGGIHGLQKDTAEHLKESVIDDLQRDTAEHLRDQTSAEKNENKLKKDGAKQHEAIAEAEGAGLATNSLLAVQGLETVKTSIIAEINPEIFAKTMKWINNLDESKIKVFDSKVGNEIKDRDELSMTLLAMPREFPGGLLKGWTNFLKSLYPTLQERGTAGLLEVMNVATEKDLVPFVPFINAVMSTTQDMRKNDPDFA